jgi:hypothetical protein
MFVLPGIRVIPGKNVLRDIGNLGPGLGQAQKCGRVKPVNRIPALTS